MPRVPSLSSQLQGLVDPRIPWVGKGFSESGGLDSTPVVPDHPTKGLGWGQSLGKALSELKSG